MDKNLQTLSDLIAYNTYKEDLILQQFESHQMISPSTLRELILWGDVGRVKDEMFKAHILASLLIEISGLSGEIIQNVKDGKQDAREALKVIEDLEIVANEIKEHLEDI